MPFHTFESSRYYWQLDGEGPDAWLLIHGLGLDRGMWFGVAPALAARGRVVTVDLPGHGAVRDESAQGVELAAAALRQILETAATPQVHVCGQDWGGAIAIQLATDAPDWITGMTLIDPRTSAAPRELSSAAKARGGVAADYLNRLRTDLPPQPPEFPFAELLEKVRAPVSVIQGMHAPGARMASTTTTAGGSLVPLESPHTVIRALTRSANDTASSAEAAARGQARRREVLGDAWVDRSLSNRTEFNADFQNMIARVAWEEIWTRPGLDDRTRRLLVLAITASLGRWEEFRLHVRSGIERDGFSVTELKETLMQTGIYAGVPAANTGFAEASRILEELGAFEERD